MIRKLPSYSKARRSLFDNSVAVNRADHSIQAVKQPPQTVYDLLALNNDYALDHHVSFYRNVKNGSDTYKAAIVLR